MSDFFGNHIVGFPTRRLICLSFSATFHLISVMILWHSAFVFMSIPIFHILGCATLTAKSHVYSTCKEVATRLEKNEIEHLLNAHSQITREHELPNFV